MLADFLKAQDVEIALPTLSRYLGPIGPYRYAWRRPPEAAWTAGQVWLLEDRCDRAREEFTQAGELWRAPGWAATVQLARAHADAQDKNDAAARDVLTRLLAAPDRANSPDRRPVRAARGTGPAFSLSFR